MAVDLASTITYLKDHAMEHGFHVHDERHFVETFTLRQTWEIDVHPADACNGPLDLHISLDVEPRLFLKFEDHLDEIEDVPTDVDGDYTVTFFFNWSIPPMSRAPDLISLAAELAGIGGIDLPIDVSSVESMGALDHATDKRLSVVGKVDRSLVDIVFSQDSLCGSLDRVHDISMYLVENMSKWVDDHN
ncbi:MAG: hypothetical protein O3B42_09420 [Actinomycetota bacterium]|nr:hypothetical protein [Actinomycetota bacterium]